MSKSINSNKQGCFAHSIIDITQLGIQSRAQNANGRADRKTRDRCRRQSAKGEMSFRILGVCLGGFYDDSFYLNGKL